LQVTFLGTGTSQGVPVIGCDCHVCTSEDPKDKRLRTSIALQVDGQHLVVDTGPDFRRQMLRENFTDLDAVLFTHEHKDHIAGLDDVRPFNYLQGKVMPLYATERVQQSIKKDFHYAFTEKKYPGVPRFDLRTIENQPFQIGQTPITPIQVWHYKLPVLGFRFYDFTYITDANYIEPEEKEKIKGSRVLVLNALRKEDHLSHFTLHEAIELFEELQPEQGYITHISHQMGRHKEINKELPDHIQLAHDSLKVEL
jgi:phosphoribosyl 1,2-cyclic phosphate phosphodiesterase